MFIWAGALKAFTQYECSILLSWSLLRSLKIGTIVTVIIKIIFGCVLLLPLPFYTTCRVVEQLLLLPPLFMLFICGVRERALQDK